MMHEMTAEMQAAVEKATEGFSRETIIRSGKRVSDRYRHQAGEQKRLHKLQEAAAYAVSRMPATYGAAHFALEQVLRTTGLERIESCLDCGSGTGAVVLAVSDILQTERFVLLEREPAMAEICKRVLIEREIEATILENSLLDVELPRAELVTEGYMLVELSEDKRTEAIRKMWQSAEEVLLLVEPGTMEGFSVIRTAKRVLAELNAHIAAPCPANDCPMDMNDWCHFSVRISRNRLHKQVKGGLAPYEDEKFSYVAFSRREPVFRAQSRILRHPTILPGKISLELCTGEEIIEKNVTKKDLLWKQVRKAKWGDDLEICPKSGVF